ncbi:hypothetical protein SDC9_193929 [bioreactor metagenome]|uniref:Uncharacterized protein n=1 Tax=bioreactor metagenome TaxID=1076179 RepID=A0A645IG50_9ZZZZ
MVEDFAGVVVFEVDEDGGDDLRVLVLDQVGDGLCVHPLQAFDARGFAALQDARDQVGGLVVAERLGQHRADVVIGVYMDGRMFLDVLVKVVEHGLDRGPRHRLEGGHRMAELLHLARAEVLEHFGGVVLAQRDEQGRALFQSVVSWHWRPSIP